jgi:hypothetical protein
VLRWNAAAEAFSLSTSNSTSLVLAAVLLDCAAWGYCAQCFKQRWHVAVPSDTVPSARKRIVAALAVCTVGWLDADG